MIRKYRADLLNEVVKQYYCNRLLEGREFPIYVETKTFKKAVML